MGDERKEIKTQVEAERRFEEPLTSYEIEHLRRKSTLFHISPRLYSLELHYYPNNEILNFFFPIFTARLRRAGGARSKALWKVRGRVEHRGDLLHPPVRIPALLRRERRQPLRTDPQG